MSKREDILLRKLINEREITKDLLEALKELMNIAKKTTPCSDGNCVYCRAERVISKAEGE
jgi:hypothetical protein